MTEEKQEPKRVWAKPEHQIPMITAWIRQFTPIYEGGKPTDKYARTFEVWSDDNSTGALFMEKLIEEANARKPGSVKAVISPGPKGDQKTIVMDGASLEEFKAFARIKQAELRTSVQSAGPGQGA